MHLIFNHLYFSLEHTYFLIQFPMNLKINIWNLKSFLAVNTQRQIKCRIFRTTKTSVLSVITSKRLVHTTSRHGSSSPSNPGVPDISYAGDSPQYVEKLDQRVSHTPVMVSEVIDILQSKNGKVRHHGSFARQYR